MSPWAILALIATPMLATSLYLYLGFNFWAWATAWVVFLAIPVVAILAVTLGWRSGSQQPMIQINWPAGMLPPGQQQQMPQQFTQAPQQNPNGAIYKGNDLR
ncbi:MAG: hypothetical protein LBM23_02585 [Propionibacteriaceae bacterium]|jgi:hypothetical protein|nr:hypothetical protein [Propionibacteriaceae bacterium]